MLNVGVSEFRANINKVLQQVQNGEVVSLLLRGKEIARIVPPDYAQAAARQELEALRRDAVVDDVLAALSGHVEAVFLPGIADRFSVEWLDVNDDRLGMTRFEEGSNELIRRRRLRLDPGEVTIGLHPALLEDEELYRHTFAHELFHAAGLMLHTELHDRLTNQVAPSPAMKDSPLLQKMRSAVLDTLRVQEWTCKHCGFSWKRTTVRRPTRCIKCARPM